MDNNNVSFGESFSAKAEIFFLDEPFVGIDVTSEETIIKILGNYVKKENDCRCPS